MLPKKRTKYKLSNKIHIKNIITENVVLMKCFLSLACEFLENFHQIKSLVKIYFKCIVTRQIGLNYCTHDDWI